GKGGGNGVGGDGGSGGESAKIIYIEAKNFIIDKTESSY
ncbi:hypothetical protein LCGC14_2165040, partial [marine sediment metagenome]